MPEPPAPVQTVVWRDGKTRITTDNAYLEISNRVQVRFTEEFPDDRTQLAGTREAGDPRGSWRIRRAKFKVEGWMMRTWRGADGRHWYVKAQQRYTESRQGRWLVRQPEGGQPVVVASAAFGTNGYTKRDWKVAAGQEAPTRVAGCLADS